MNELDRIRAEYARRQRDPRLHGRYTLFNRGNLFTVQERERMLLAFLRRMDLEILGELDVLDVGCGAGGWLGDLLRYGASAARLHGCDLLPDRLNQARRRQLALLGRTL